MADPLSDDEQMHLRILARAPSVLVGPRAGLDAKAIARGHAATGRTAQGLVLTITAAGRAVVAALQSPPAAR